MEPLRMFVRDCLRRLLAAGAVAIACSMHLALAAVEAGEESSKKSIVIGDASVTDEQRTRVEATGYFVPGRGGYEVCFWVYDAAAEKFYAPTQTGAKLEHGVADGRSPRAWSKWNAGDIGVKTEVCQVEQTISEPDAAKTKRLQLVATRLHLNNAGGGQRKLLVYAVVRPLSKGAPPITALAASEANDALKANDRWALVSLSEPEAAGVRLGDIAAEARDGKLPLTTSVASPTGGCSGALRLAVTIPPGKSATLGFLCPVPGDGPAAELAELRNIKVDAIFRQAEESSRLTSPHPESQK